MPTDAPGHHAPAPPVRPAGPIISASPGQVFITGTGVLPNHRTTIRITHSGDDIVDYLAYFSDADGHLSAALPETAITETGHITVTDHRPDPAGDCGLLWSNTVIVTGYPHLKLKYSTADGRAHRSRATPTGSRSGSGPLSGPDPCRSKPRWRAIQEAVFHCWPIVAIKSTSRSKGRGDCRWPPGWALSTISWC